MPSISMPQFPRLCGGDGDNCILSPLKGAERSNFCGMFCNPGVIKDGKKSEINPNAAYSLPLSCFQTFTLPA